MLMGTFEHRLDAKSRLVLPAKFRDELGETVIAAFGMERCVSLYSRAEWEKLIRWMDAESFMSNAKARRLQRIVLASAHDLAPDGAGRILLPAVLRDYAGIRQELVVNGVNDHAEVWDRTAWAEYCQAGFDALQELAGGEMNGDA